MDYDYTKENILLTNSSLIGHSGTETWIYEMTRELSKKYNITILTNSKGKMSDIIEELGVKVITEYEGTYDFAIVNHTNTIYKLPPELYKIFTSHSLIIPIENFPKEADYRVGVTEAIAKENQVIRNGIDCERFKPTKVNDELKNIFYLSNPGYADALDFLKDACQDYNLTWIKEDTFHIDEMINEADLVISLGRGALESMACGKNVIYADHRKYWMDDFRGGGLITPENYKDFKTGEWQIDRQKITKAQLHEQFRKYNPSLGKFNRKMILEDFNIKKTAQEYINIWTNFKKDI